NTAATRGLRDWLAAEDGGAAVRGTSPAVVSGYTPRPTPAPAFRVPGPAGRAAACAGEQARHTSEGIARRDEPGSRREQGDGFGPRQGQGQARRGLKPGAARIGAPHRAAAGA